MVERELEVVEADDRSTRVFALRGFVSGPQVQKMNRNSIFLFVNGRLIRDRLLLHALSSAYHNLMPPACYPFALLFVDCDCEEVDVNVHPSKTEVRFRHGNFVHDFVRDSIRERLIASRPASGIPLSAAAATRGRFAVFRFYAAHRESALRADAWRPRPGRSASKTCRFSRSTLRPRPNRASISSTCGQFRVPDTHGPLAPHPTSETPQSLTALSDLRPLGQIHDSFIIAAGRDGLWIIDQHVAHERILFEKVLRQQARGRVERQQLLMPILLDLTAGQQIEYARIADELDRSGFDSEPFGNRTIAVKGAPAGVGPAEIEKLVFEILEMAEGEASKVSLDDLRRGMAASIACRAAIKINMRLDHTQNGVAADANWPLPIAR